MCRMYVWNLVTIMMARKSGRDIIAKKSPFLKIHFNQKTLLVNIITTPKNQFINLRNSKINIKTWNQTRLDFSSLILIYFLDNIKVWNGHHPTSFIKWNPGTPISTNLVTKMCENNNSLSLCWNSRKISLLKKQGT